MPGKGLEQLEIAGNGQKWLGKAEMAESGLKWPEMAGYEWNGWKC